MSNLDPNDSNSKIYDENNSLNFFYDNFFIVCITQ